MSTFLHPLLIASQKGEDFHNGGGIIQQADKLVFYEDDLEPGDVAIYSGRTEHGVFNVDAEQVLDLSRLNGRSSILASLFKC